MQTNIERPLLKVTAPVPSGDVRRTGEKEDCAYISAESRLNEPITLFLAIITIQIQLIL